MLLKEAQEDPDYYFGVAILAVPTIVVLVAGVCMVVKGVWDGGLETW